MNIHFNSGFISPEEIEAQRRQQEERLRQMVNDKKCVVCNNTYLINDQITYCSIKNECVDFMDGMNCDNWHPIDGLPI